MGVDHVVLLRAPLQVVLLAGPPQGRLQLEAHVQLLQIPHVVEAHLLGIC